MTLLFLWISQAPAQAPAVPHGLPPPGSNTVLSAPPKTLAFEMEVLKTINALRAGKGLVPLTMDERLRQFCRQQAEYSASGDPAARTALDRVQKQRLGPDGFFLQNTFGKAAADVVKALRVDKTTEAALAGEYARAGIGAVWVEAKPPAFQVTLLVVNDPDPMTGKPGLSNAQTDPVMAAAAKRMTGECYNPALAKNPNLRGDLLFQIVITGDGSVERANLLKSMDDEAVEACAVKVVEALRFPAPYKGKPVTLHHPVRFTPPQGDVQVGRLRPSEIESTFATTAADFRACYDVAAKAGNPKLKGSLIVAAHVGADGGVMSTSIKEDKIHTPALTDCVLTRVHDLRFPRPEFDGELDVEFPLSFAPAAPVPVQK